MSAPVLWAVTGVNGVAHLVTDDAMAADRPAGRYVACCGAEVVATSLPRTGAQTLPGLPTLEG